MSSSHTVHFAPNGPHTDSIKKLWSPYNVVTDLQHTGYLWLLIYNILVTCGFRARVITDADRLAKPPLEHRRNGALSLLRLDIFTGDLRFRRRFGRPTNGCGRFRRLRLLSQ
ncbi:hypothetical protein EVAR_61161_1 [Eumeta japonica]|uniref:Uncharacterized protein n=1 Tax=Eumeta variegata TaxID=151549 RepID=A0A4C1ZT10_EUMVA|nr:hypothetical protein EVAR_61161_1 [Eumeta japonica]